MTTFIQNNLMTVILPAASGTACALISLPLEFSVFAVASTWCVGMLMDNYHSMKNTLTMYEASKEEKINSLERQISELTAGQMGAVAEQGNRHYTNGAAL